MSPDSKSFVSLYPSSSVSVMTADGTPMPLAGVGSVVTPHLSLSNVYHIPKLKLNLVSVSQLCDSGYSVSFSSTSCHVQDPQSQKLIGTGRRRGGLYVLATSVSAPKRKVWIFQSYVVRDVTYVRSIRYHCFECSMIHLRIMSR